MTDSDRSAPPPVEALPEVAWARVEREVWVQLDGGTPIAVRSRRTWWLAVPALAVAAVLAVVLTRSPSPPALEPSPTRIVSQSSPSTIALVGAHITLDPQSAVVERSDSEIIVEHGAAWFAIEPRGALPSFVVIAGDAHIRVVGTRFRVACEGEHVAVEVDHGVVEVGYHGQLVRLTAGEHWSSEPAPVVVANPSLPPVVARPAPIVPQVAPPPVIHAPVDRDGATFSELSRLEATDPATAMKGYLALSRGAGRWAELALFAAARLAVERHDPAAGTLLDIYLRRFPRGANVADARELLTHIQGGHP